MRITTQKSDAAKLAQRVDSAADYRDDGGDQEDGSEASAKPALTPIRLKESAPEVKTGALD
jgi:hypothetical protein